MQTKKRYKKRSKKLKPKKLKPKKLKPKKFKNFITYNGLNGKEKSWYLYVINKNR